MYAIYALIDPRDHLIHYIGVTDDVYARFLQHIRCDGSNPGKDAWIHELKQANEMVIMQTLQVVGDLDQARKREGYWIRHYYDLAMPLTNQVIPISENNVVIIEKVVVPESVSQPRLKPHMTFEEQQTYIHFLLRTGISRQKLLAKVDGYIHRRVVEHVLNECMLHSLSSLDREVLTVQPREEIDETIGEPSIHQLAERADATFDGRTLSYPRLSSLQEELFVTAYQLTGNIDESLKRAGVNTRYRDHARLIIQQRHLKKEK